MAATETNATYLSQLRQQVVNLLMGEVRQSVLQIFDRLHKHTEAQQNVLRGQKCRNITHTTRSSSSFSRKRM